MGRWSADGDPVVETQRLHDLEGGSPGELPDVGGGQDAGVFGDDGRGGAFGDGVEVGFDAGPDVLPGGDVEGDRVDRSQCLAGAGFDVGDVLLVNGDVARRSPARRSDPRAGGTRAQWDWRARRPRAALLRS